MGSYPRGENAEREARECAAMQRALDCQACGALTPGARFFAIAAVESSARHANRQNPQSRVRTVQSELLAPRDICLNFIPRDGVAIQVDAHGSPTMLGPPIRVQSADTLRHLLAYLAAAEFTSKSSEDQP